MVSGKVPNIRVWLHISLSISSHFFKPKKGASSIRRITVGMHVSEV